MKKFHIFSTNSIFFYIIHNFSKGLKNVLFIIYMKVVRLNTITSGRQPVIPIENQWLSIHYFTRAGLESPKIKCYLLISKTSEIFLLRQKHFYRYTLIHQLPRLHEQCLDKLLHINTALVYTFFILVFQLQHFLPNFRKVKKRGRIRFEFWIGIIGQP